METKLFEQEKKNLIFSWVSTHMEFSHTHLYLDMHTPHTHTHASTNTQTYSHILNTLPSPYYSLLFYLSLLRLSSPKADIITIHYFTNLNVSIE